MRKVCISTTLVLQFDSEATSFNLTIGGQDSQEHRAISNLLLLGRWSAKQTHVNVRGNTEIANFFTYFFLFSRASSSRLLGQEHRNSL